jgi:hypothetical protein
MANYTKLTNFAAKDALSSGNPSKVIKGTEIDAEFNAIATAISTKPESTAIPAGIIVMWSGAIIDVPSGWYLCDGTNGTPNLRDRFVIGAGSTYSVAATGGSKDAIVGSHTHTATFTGSALSGHSHGVSDPGHSHAMPNNQVRVTINNTWIGTTYNSERTSVSNLPTESATTGISINSASAGTPAGSVAVSTTGDSVTNANLPPYYALAFIMKAA